MDEIKKEEAIKKEQEKVKEIINLSQIDELIKKNEIEFEVDDIQYKVRKATFKEKQEVYNKRIQKYTELLRDERYLLETDLKKIYLSRNINIEEMEKKALALTQRREDLMLKLGETIKNKGSENELLEYRKEIESYNSEIQELITRKNALLEVSLENQVIVFSYSYLTFLVTEKKVKDKWIKAWNTWEEYEAEKERVVNNASYYATLLGSVETIIE